jgi:LCP family protein required for cell wall assembly
MAWGLPLTLVTVVGLTLGLYFYVLTQVATRPGPPPAERARLFAFPLRLAERVNILVMGVDVTYDTRRQVINVARADSLVLVSVDPERRRIAALSIPRDTRVIIPGVGENKVNAAFAFGGPPLTIRTVERLLAVKVHYYVKLGPDSFKNLIDAVGGLEVDVERDMKYTDSWAGYTIDLKRGRQWLDGEQVTGYIRFRYDALGDISRVERQRKVLQLLIQRLKQPETVLHAPRLLQAFVANTETNLGAVELMTLGAFGLRLQAPLEGHTLPGAFAPQYWEPNFARIRPMVAELFYGVSAEELAQTPVEVYNASGRPGMARQAAARLREVGFRNISVASAPDPVDVTTVTSRMPSPGLARLAAAALGRSVLRHEPEAPGAPITIMIARDAARQTQGALPRRAPSE